MTTEKMFVPIADQFKKYGQDLYSFVIGKAIDVDKALNTVTIQTETEKRVMRYDSLIIATGTNSKSVLWQVNDSQEVTKREFTKVRQRLETAKTVLIAGGGATGVETAGEIANKYPEIMITLISGSSRVLPRTLPKTSAKAEGRLEKLGVELLHNVRTGSAIELENGSTRLTFSTGEQRVVDVYIDATGGRPNTTFLPEEWITQKGHVKVDEHTCRVVGAISCYAAGDCASNTDGTIFSGGFSIAPTCLALAHDIATAEGIKYPVAQKKAGNVPICAVPVGPTGGVGEAFGWGLPSFLVKALKCGDYLMSKMSGMIAGDQV